MPIVQRAHLLYTYIYLKSMRIYSGSQNTIHKSIMVYLYTAEIPLFVRKFSKVLLSEWDKWKKHQCTTMSNKCGSMQSAFDCIESTKDNTRVIKQVNRDCFCKGVSQWIHRYTLLCVCYNDWCCDFASFILKINASTDYNAKTLHII